MKPDKEVAPFLLHIIDAIEKIESYLEHASQEQFLKSPWDQDAVIRNLEIIGEAITHVDSDMKQSYPDIPWRRITDLRNVLIHEYFGLDMDLIWEIMMKNIPGLKKEIKNILNDLKK